MADFEDMNMNVPVMEEQPPQPNIIDILINGQQSMTHAVQTLIAHANTPRVPNIKFREPPTFTGKVEEVDGFIFAVLDSITIQEGAFNTDEKKVKYFGSFLDKSARAWFMGLRKYTPEILNNFDEFLQRFKTHFGDPDRKTSISRTLDKLVQTSSCTAYSARFRELIAELDLTEFTIMEKYFKGLKQSVRDVFLFRDKPNTFDELEKTCILSDNKIFAREQDLRLSGSRQRDYSLLPAPYQRRPQSNQPASATSRFVSTNQPPATPATGSTPLYEPMEIDSIRRGPLTKEERDRRRQNRLCMYCGGSGHIASNCSKIPESRRQNNRTTTISALTSNPTATITPVPENGESKAQ